MSNAWIQVAAARRDLADLVETLPPHLQQGSTLCEGWTPHLVLAHVTSFVEVSMPKQAFAIVRAGSYDKSADAIARRLAEQPVDELAATLRAKAGKKNPLPTWPGELTLADVVVHTQDIRRGVDQFAEVPIGRLRMVLDFLTTNRKARYISDPSRIRGLAFQATDLDWSHGDATVAGGAITGTAEALMMAIAGRDTTAELIGPIGLLQTV